MRVRFYCAWSKPKPGELDVEYGFGDARVPVEGERVVSYGYDPGFPAGDYLVRAVRWQVGPRGPEMATVYLERRS